MKDFINCLGVVVSMTALVFMTAFAGTGLSALVRSSNTAEFTLSQGSIWIRDPKGIEYIDFKVTMVWTVCQKCHFDSAAWQKHRKERGF